MRCIELVIAMIIFYLLVSFSCYANENLVKNGSFKEVNDNLPAYWSEDSYNKSDEETKYNVGKTRLSSGAYTNYVTIENIKENDARLVQEISVKPLTNYKLSCWIKAENCKSDRKGANISVIHGRVFGTSRDFKDTQGIWEYVEYYIKTDKEQKYLTVAIRLGGYGSVTTGKASFYDFKIIEVDKDSIDAPVNRIIESENQNGKQEPRTGKPIKIINYLSLIFIIILLSLVIWFLIKIVFLYLNKKKDKTDTEPSIPSDPNV